MTERHGRRGWHLADVECLRGPLAVRRYVVAVGVVETSTHLGRTFDPALNPTRRSYLWGKIPTGEVRPKRHCLHSVCTSHPGENVPVLLDDPASNCLRELTFEHDSMRLHTSRCCLLYTSDAAD